MRPHYPIEVKKSTIDGKGAFSCSTIPARRKIGELEGEIISVREGRKLARKNKRVALVELDERYALNAFYTEGVMKYINHSCAPNCEAVDDKGRIFIEAIRHIKPGQELNYDYNLQFEERYTAAVKKRFPCWCGNKNCRGTLLGPKERK